jgi:CUE domain
MQLEFSQAMSDFKTMFPDMDRDVIEAVLRANQGAVDATIDQLLAMSTDNQVSRNDCFVQNEKLSHRVVFLE